MKPITEPEEKPLSAQLAPSLAQRLYALCASAVFIVLALVLIGVNLFVPSLRRRRLLAGAFSRLFLRAVGIPFTVRGRERLPAGPCVVVANHASYLDGVVAIAALPPEFAFVIKKEMVRVPLASILLRRLGSEFVERFDRREGAADTRRVREVAASGQSMVFFPEGTFDEHRRVGKFMNGAFATAARCGMPVVAMAIHGTREVLPSGGMLLRRKPIRVEILAVLEAADARRRSRELIAHAVGEPLAP